MNDKRSRPGHAQKRSPVRTTRNRPLQSAVAARPRARERVRSRTHMRPLITRTRTQGDHGKKPQSESPKTVSRIERRRAIRRRRARIVWAACGGFCLLVFATSFPAQALIRQHDSISASTAELNRLTAGNVALQKQADELADPANIAALARSDYDMVSPGEKAYQVLPTTGSSAAESLSSGHSALDQGPVAPGSAKSQELLGDAGSGSSSQSGTGSGSSEHSGGSQASTGSQHSVPGLWGRVLNSFEFWR